ncbi:uncharacterized protein B0I36DRAFT_368723 [Microdochium trichocladiopsis]|uniref:Uncharacterized protein n=1 Tax=Microdochium trichocladiopsis TaxID=1682393 RepID=A0A9P8XUX4_9PEZI|nr:uncharacterized protein B0I36DRAFT_368723 [Microdochium trichocladiopsis]KAH7016107.1 hypothetical protein B0I36DRAFT_368723 [Microdochium trichocladiopsis]
MEDTRQLALMGFLALEPHLSTKRPGNYQLLKKIDTILEIPLWNKTDRPPKILAGALTYAMLCCLNFIASDNTNGGDDVALAYVVERGVSQYPLMKQLEPDSVEPDAIKDQRVYGETFKDLCTITNLLKKAIGSKETDSKRRERFKVELELLNELLKGLAEKLERTG